MQVFCRKYGTKCPGLTEGGVCSSLVKKIQGKLNATKLKL